MNNNIIDLYKESWESHNTDILSQIFHEEIRYQEHCNNIIVGLINLKKYWVTNSNKQSNVRFSPIKIFNNKNELVVHWEASFYEKIKCKNVYLEGIMWLSFKGEKVIEFIEFFEHKNNESKK